MPAKKAKKASEAEKAAAAIVYNVRMHNKSKYSNNPGGIGIMKGSARKLREVRQPRPVNTIRKKMQQTVFEDL